MVSTPVLTIFLVLIAVYLSGCLAYHIRDTREERAHQKDSARRSAPRQDDAHAIHR